MTAQKLPGILRDRLKEYGLEAPTGFIGYTGDDEAEVDLEKEKEQLAMEKAIEILRRMSNDGFYGNHVHEALKMGIDALEKQKEHFRDDTKMMQKPLSTEETELNSIAFLEQLGYTCIPPKKEHQNNSDAPKNALGGALNSPLDKDKNLDDIAQDYVEAVKEYNHEPTWNLMQTAVCYGYHYREEEEQKPAEWSEEDKEELKYTVSVLERCGFSDSANWIKDLPNRFNLQPKQEWSEEDEQIRKEIIWAIKSGMVYDVDLIGVGHIFSVDWKVANRWLAYLEKQKEQKPAEWSDWDERIRKTLLDCYEEALKKYDCVEWLNGITYGELCCWLEHLRAHPHWKPSEEQMGAIEECLRFYTESTDTHQHLKSLLNDLKNLL